MMDNSIENKIKDSIASIKINPDAKERGLNLLNTQYTDSGYDKKNTSIFSFLKFALIFSLILITIPISIIAIDKYQNRDKGNNITDNTNNNIKNTKATPIVFKGVDPSLVTDYVLEASTIDIFDTQAPYDVITKSLEQMDNLISFKTNEKVYDINNNIINKYIGYNYNNPDILSAVLEYKTNEYHIKEEIFSSKTKYIRNRENELNTWSNWKIEESTDDIVNRYIPSNIIEISEGIEIHKEKLDNNYVYTYNFENRLYRLVITPSLTIIQIRISDNENVFEIDYNEFNKNYGILPAKMMQPISWIDDKNKIITNIEANITQSNKESRSYIVEYKNTDTLNPEIIYGTRINDQQTYIDRAEYKISQKDNKKEIKIIGNNLYIYQNNKWDTQQNENGYTINDYEKLSINEVLEFYISNKNQYTVSEIYTSTSHSIYLKNISYKLQDNTSPTNYYIEITYNQYYEIVSISIHKYNGDQYISSKYINYHNPVNTYRIEVPTEFQQQEQTLIINNSCSEYRDIKKIISKLKFEYSSLFNVRNIKSNLSNCEYILEYNYMTLHIKNTDSITHSNYFSTITDNSYSILKSFSDGNKLIRTNIVEDEYKDYHFSYGTMNTENKYIYKNTNTIQEWNFSAYIPSDRSQEDIDKFISMTDKVVLSFKEE